MGRMGVVPTTCIVFVHLTIGRILGGAKSTTPLQVCLVGSNMLAERRAILLCLSISRNLNVSQTFMGGPRLHISLHN